MGLIDGEACGRVPVPITRLIGRRRELAEANRWLGSARLMTLTGPAGVGKTRLALELASGVARRSSVWFVELASLRDAPGPVQALAAATGLAEGGSAESVAERLRDRSGLVVLDNCEHLVDACARLAVALLERCSGLRVLATSREALDVPGEVVRSVPGLHVPAPDSRPSAGRLLRCDAVRFLYERARERRPDSRFDEASAVVAAQVCRRLDGNPLAIELAAARIAHLPLEEILRRLEDRFELLRSPGRAVSPRHRTLRAALDWSHELLGGPERALFRRLSVFRGSFGLDAVAEVCGVGPAALDEVARLTSKSLVVALDVSGEPRYRLLETMRAYASDRLVVAGEQDEVRAEHAGWFLEVAERASPLLYGHRAAATLARLELEHDNLRAALDWALEHEPAIAGRLGSALGHFWVVRGYLAEGRERLERCLAVASDGDGPPTTLLLAAGNLALRQDDFGASRRYLASAVVAAATAGRQAVEARAHDLLGRAELESGNYDEADAQLGLALRLYRRVRSAGGEARVHWHLNLLAQCRGDYRSAHEHALRMQALCRSIEDPWGTGLAHLALAHLGLIDGHLDTAARELLSSLRWLGPLGERWSLASALRVTAGLAAERGAGESGLVLMGAAEGIDDAIGGRLTRVLQRPMTRWRDLVERGRAPDRARAALARGRRLTLAEAVDLALDVASRGGRGPAASLTSREAAVADLMAQGITDREIGARLGISVRTVEKHAENIRSKIGVRSRSELAAARAT